MAEDEKATDGGGAAFSIANEDENDETTATAANARPIFLHNNLFAAVEESILSCQLVIDFFYHPNTQNEDGDTTANTMKIQQCRDAIYDTIHWPKFNKAGACRLFAGLTPLLQKVAEEESYIPTDDDGDYDNDKGNSTIQESEFMVASST